MTTTTEYRCFLAPDVIADLAPISYKQAEMLIAMGLTEPDILSNKPEAVEALQQVHEKMYSDIFLYAVMWKRLEHVGVDNRISKVLAMWLTSTCATPADSVMWAYTLCLILKEDGACNISNFVARFPNGVPTEQARQRAWLAQKSQGSNWLDLMQWPTIEAKPDANTEK
jgi:hypothetical protein